MNENLRRNGLLIGAALVPTVVISTFAFVIGSGQAHSAYTQGVEMETHYALLSSDVGSCRALAATNPQYVAMCDDLAREAERYKPLIDAPKVGK